MLNRQAQKFREILTILIAVKNIEIERNEI